MNMVKPIAFDGCTDAVLLNDWHVIGFSTDFEVGKLAQTTLLGRDLVVWRSENGAVHAWEDLCIHRGSRLSKGFIRNDCVVCPYHGWHYDAGGQCVLIPAVPDETPMRKARALTFRTEERYGFVWTCLGVPANDIPLFPEWGNNEYKIVGCGPYVFKSGYRAMENNVDPSHFPFVHAGLNGVLDKPDPIPPYEVNEGEDGLSSSEVRVTQPFGDPRGVPVISYYAYKIMRPLVCYFRKRVVISDPARAAEGNENDRFCVYFTVQMVDETRSLVRTSNATNFARQPSEEDVHRRQDLVMAQDSGIVDTQRPERIPVDLRQELHHRIDLLSLRYRSWLDRLGVTYGIH